MGPREKAVREMADKLSGIIEQRVREMNDDEALRREAHRSDVHITELKRRLDLKVHDLSVQRIGLLADAERIGAIEDQTAAILASAGVATA